MTTVRTKIFMGYDIDPKKAEQLEKLAAHMDKLKEGDGVHQDGMVREHYFAVKKQFEDVFGQALIESRRMGWDTKLPRRGLDALATAISDDQFSAELVEDENLFRQGPQGDEIYSKYREYRAESRCMETGDIPFGGAIRNLWEMLYKLEEKLGKINPESKKGMQQMQQLQTKIQAVFQMINQLTELSSKLLQNKPGESIIGNMR